MEPEAKLWCTTCGKEFNFDAREPKQLNCLHTICLQCAQDMVTQSDRSTITCTTCHHRQRVATGNCRQLPQSFRIVQMMRILHATKAHDVKGVGDSHDLSTGTPLESYAAGIEKSLRLLKNRHDEIQNSEYLNVFAIRARTAIKEAVSRAETDLRRRGYTLNEQLDWLIQSYKTRPLQVLKEKIGQAEDINKRIQRVLNHPQVADQELEYITSRAPSIIAEQNSAAIPVLEGFDASFDLTALAESISQFGSIRIKPEALNQFLTGEPSSGANEQVSQVQGTCILY